MMSMSSLSLCHNKPLCAALRPSARRLAPIALRPAAPSPLPNALSGNACNAFINRFNGTNILGKHSRRVILARSSETGAQRQAERSLEEVLNLHTLTSMTMSETASPSNVDVLETMVALNDLLDPEEADDMPTLLTKHPELLHVPADALTSVAQQLQPLPSCYSRLESTLLAARVAASVPEAHVPQVSKLAAEFHAVYNAPLPRSLPSIFQSSATSIPTIAQRATAFANLMPVPAALAALTEHPYLLDYDTPKLEARMQLLEEVLYLEPGEAREVVGKEPGALLLTAPMIYQRLDDLAERFGLTAWQMRELVLQEASPLVSDLEVLSAKWKCLTALSFQDAAWQGEVQHMRASFLALLTRCTLPMLEGFVQHCQEGERLPRAAPLMALLLLEFQFTQAAPAVDSPDE